MVTGILGYWVVVPRNIWFSTFPKPTVNPSNLPGWSGWTHLHHGTLHGCRVHWRCSPSEPAEQGTCFDVVFANPPFLVPGKSWVFGRNKWGSVAREKRAFFPMDTAKFSWCWVVICLWSVRIVITVHGSSLYVYSVLKTTHLFGRAFLNHLLTQNIHNFGFVDTVMRYEQTYPQNETAKHASKKYPKTFEEHRPSDQCFGVFKYLLRK